MEDKVSIMVDYENSRGSIDGGVPICNPHNSFWRHFDIPNTKILEARVARAEEA